jgi:ribonuclease J
VHRVQRLLELAAAQGRRAVLLGRGLSRNVRLATELGLFREPPGVRVEPEAAARIPARDLLVLATGAQGETGSGLAKLAAGDHPHVHIEPGDTVVFSSRSIPGNEVAIADIANRLARLGATIIERALDPIHASGHAQADEQRILLDAVRPRRFVPIHGEYRMLLAHARTAMGMGLSPADVFVLEDGEVLSLSGGDARMAGSVPSGRLWLDGRAGEPVAEPLLLERELLADTGVVVASIVVSGSTGMLLQGPELVSRGVPGFEPGGELLAAAIESAKEALLELAPEQRRSRVALEEALNRGVRRAFRRETGRRPPVVGVAAIV